MKEKQIIALLTAEEEELLSMYRELSEAERKTVYQCVYSFRYPEEINCILKATEDAIRQRQLENYFKYCYNRKERG